MLAAAATAAEQSPTLIILFSPSRSKSITLSLSLSLSLTDEGKREIRASLCRELGENGWNVSFVQIRRRRATHNDSLLSD